MALAKGFLQGTVVVLWAAYAVVRIVAAVGGGAAGTADPTAGVGLVTGFLGALPVGALVLPTAAMVLSLVGLEVAFAIIRRYGRA